MKLKNLVVVESPAKARTLEKYLGSNFRVKASLGHVRDLPKSKLGLDVENDFQPKYVIPLDKRKLVKDLKDTAKTAGDIYLATDPDREGEAIAWHLMEAMGLGPRQVHRVDFHEITEHAVKEAISHPRKIDMDLVDAQQARRVLDRLVGYSSARCSGRRSAAACRRGGCICRRAARVEREREIDAFQPIEYWTSTPTWPSRHRAASPSIRRRRLPERGGQKVELHNQAETDAHRAGAGGCGLA